MTMRDKLTRKRIRVDYLLVIKIAGQECDFLSWCQSKRSRISFNRLGYAYCKHKKLDVDSIYSRCIARNLFTFEDYQKECIRLAQDHSCWEDD